MVAILNFVVVVCDFLIVSPSTGLLTKLLLGTLFIRGFLCAKQKIEERRTTKYKKNLSIT
jgi:hypothetical protein